MAASLFDFGGGRAFKNIENKNYDTNVFDYCSAAVGSGVDLFPHSG